MKKCIWLLLMILFTVSGEASATEFTLITSGGFVRFSVGDNWGVIAMETKKPNQTAAFQVPMLGELESDPPTNVSIILINPKLPESTKTLEVIGRSYGSSSVSQVSYKGWSTYRQIANDSGVDFTVVDAKKSVADVVVWIRFAWPSARNEEAEPLLLALLDSIQGDLGLYKPRDGEVIRRPVK